MLNKLLNEIGFTLTAEQEKAFNLYCDFLLEYNKITNLTAITDRDEVFVKHFYDSILLAKSIDLTKINNLCDVGSGAGFPSIPLKIMYPHLDIIIIDSLDKRIQFLTQLCQKLSLTDVTLIHARAEECDVLRESFDLVTARAVARQNILNELCIPLVKVNGYFVSMKGKNALEELKEGNSLAILNGKIIKENEYTLPMDDAKRFIIVIKHFARCPIKYPRTFASIKKRPL